MNNFVIMIIKNLLLSLLLFITISISAQISDSQIQKIDSLFIEWNNSNHPGGVIGIMQNGKTIFSKAYGLASVEYQVPNSIETIFNTGSVSKQFTAMGIVILQQQGKLSVNDDIRKYLPELPKFDNPITISHLLHHTSGLRSLHDMLGLAGWRSDDSRTNEDLNRFMKNQHELNFKPGEEFLYCNSGYMLMSNIIEKVTGEKFPIWMKNSIFEPLGMTNTYVEDNYSRIVPNNATSYYEGKKNNFERAVEYWGYIGSGNMHSSSADLLKWLNNFYNPQPNWEIPFKTLQTLDKFNNGEDNNYAYGIILDETNGHKRVQHGGSIGGFRAFLSIYPEDKLSIAILTNFSTSSPSQKEKQISEILLKKLAEENLVNGKINESLKIVPLSNDQLRKFEASYWNDKDNYAVKIYLKNDTLRYFISKKNEKALAPIGKNEFQILDITAAIKIKFELDKNGEKTIIETTCNKTPIHFKVFNPTTPTKAELTAYTGKFYSEELETTYQISLKDETLSWHHMRHGDFEMKVLKKDVLEGQYPFSIAKYSRDENEMITGIFVSNGRAKNVWFKKQK